MSVADSLTITDDVDQDFPAEFESEFAPDPAPDEKPRSSRRDPVVKASRKAPVPTARLAKQVGDELAGVVEMVAAGWQMAGDECCSPVLEEQAKPLGAAIANILKRYPTLLAKCANSDFLSMGLSVAMLTAAVRPVVVAIYQNHVAKEEPGDDAGAQLAEHFAAHASGPLR
jgi:hypothetical protein